MSLGCFIDKNGDRIMPTLLHVDFSDPNVVKVCSQKASARGFSVFGVEAGGQCFSGVNAGLTFKKHGQAPDGDCIDGKGANHRMSVYEFSKLSLLFPTSYYFLCSTVLHAVYCFPGWPNNACFYSRFLSSLNNWWKIWSVTITTSHWLAFLAECYIFDAFGQELVDQGLFSGFNWKRRI